MKLLQAIDHREGALVLDHMVMQTQPFIDQVSDQDAATDRHDPETMRELRGMGIDSDSIGFETEDPMDGRYMQPADDQNLLHNTPFSAVIEEGDTAPGCEYMAESDDGVRQLVTIEQVYSTVERGRLVRHVDGTVQPLG